MLKSEEMLSYVFAEKEYLFLQLSGPGFKPSKSCNHLLVDFERALDLYASYTRYLESSSKNC